MIKLPIFISVFILTSFLSHSAQADNFDVCLSLLQPIDNQVASVKARGGVWEAFEKRSLFRNHSTVALHLDQKAIALIYTLDYICRSLNGIPRNDVSNYIFNLESNSKKAAFLEVKNYLQEMRAIEQNFPGEKLSKIFLNHWSDKGEDFYFILKSIDLAGIRVVRDSSLLGSLSDEDKISLFLENY